MHSFICGACKHANDFDIKIAKDFWHAKCHGKGCNCQHRTSEKAESK